MPTSPDRERTARCLADYLDQVPMPTEERMELALSVLRGLPPEATPEQALDALLARLPQSAAAYPPGRPAIARGHMPAQYLGRPRTGLRGFVSQWGWVLVVTLLLALTLLLNMRQ